MNQQVLEPIAQSLTQRCREFAQGSGEYFNIIRESCQGLGLALEVTSHSYTLTLSRKGMPPSQDEVVTCKVLLGIPPDATYRPGFCHDGDVTYHLVRISWARYQQAPLFQQPPEKPYVYA